MPSKNTITLQFGEHEGRNIQGLVIPTAHLAGVIARHLIYMFGGDPGKFEQYKPTIADPIKVWEDDKRFVSVSLVETAKIVFSDGRMVDDTPAFDPTKARLEVQERITAGPGSDAGPIPGFLLKDAPRETVEAMLDASTRLGKAFPGLADAVQALSRLGTATGGRMASEMPNMQEVKKDSEMGKIACSVFGTNTGRRSVFQPAMLELLGSSPVKLETALAGVGSASPADRLERQTGSATGTANHCPVWPRPATRVGYPKHATRVEKAEADEERFANALFSLNYRVENGAEYPAAEVVVSELFRISTNRLRELYDEQFDGKTPDSCKEQRLASQDGADFYSETAEGSFIVSYPDLVDGDFDMKGAEAARAVFLREFIEYKLE